MNDITADSKFSTLRMKLAMFIAAWMMSCPVKAEVNAASELTKLQVKQLASKLEVGDIVFIRINVYLFKRVAADTGSWTNHVGIVVDTSGDDPLIAESTFPLSRITSLSKFVKRSEGGRIAISRFNTPLSQEQVEAMKLSVNKRLGIFYDTGFNLYSHRQFCSRFVYEVVKEAMGINLGKIETLKTLLAENPQANMAFWRMWYFGNIPWDRETVTPASVLADTKLHSVFDGYVDIKDKKQS